MTLDQYAHYTCFAAVVVAAIPVVGLQTKKCRAVLARLPVARPLSRFQRSSSASCVAAPAGVGTHTPYMAPVASNNLRVSDIPAVLALILSSYSWPDCPVRVKTRRVKLSLG